MKKIINGLFFFLFVLSTASSALAQGDLLIYPKKLIFEGIQERVKILNFKNEGKDSSTYKISYIENRMTEEGILEIIETPDEGQLFASPFLRFYPRSITLAPGETQTVKIQLSRTNKLESGEYRSHLYIRAEEKTQARGEKDSSVKQGKIGIQLKAIYGISIPNIIRIGDTTMKTELKDILATYDNGLPVLSLKVTREGNHSLNGDLEVVHISPQGKKTYVGKKKVIIYSPIGFLNINMKLKPSEGIKLNSGRLAITFTNNEGTKKLLATESFDM